MQLYCSIPSSGPLMIALMRPVCVVCPVPLHGPCRSDGMPDQIDAAGLAALRELLLVGADVAGRDAWVQGFAPALVEQLLVLTPRARCARGRHHTLPHLIFLWVVAYSFPFVFAPFPFIPQRTLLLLSFPLLSTWAHCGRTRRAPVRLLRPLTWTSRTWPCRARFWRC